MISIDDIDRLDPSGAYVFCASLDETKNTPAGHKSGDKTLNDFSFNDMSRVRDISSMFFCTFTYSSTACFHKKEVIPATYWDDEIHHTVQFINGKIVKLSGEQSPATIKTRLIPYWDMSFIDQYDLFVKHFKRWISSMNKVLDHSARITGYQVIIELTSKGILHAHSRVYSRCNYKDGFGSTASALWANIAKGKVSAMSKAFEPVRNSSGLHKYMLKVQNQII